MGKKTGQALFDSKPHCGDLQPNGYGQMTTTTGAQKLEDRRRGNP